MADEQWSYDDTTKFFSLREDIYTYEERRGSLLLASIIYMAIGLLLLALIAAAPVAAIPLALLGGAAVLGSVAYFTKRALLVSTHQDNLKELERLQEKYDRIHNVNQKKPDSLAPNVTSELRNNIQTGVTDTVIPPAHEASHQNSTGKSPIKP